MRILVIKSDIEGGNQEVLSSFDNMGDALDFASYKCGSRNPMQVDKFTFLWIADDVMVFTQMEHFYLFRVGSIVQADLNNSPYRFHDAEIIDCFANGFYPNYVLRLQDGTERIVREKDIRIQRLGK